MWTEGATITCQAFRTGEARLGDRGTLESEEEVEATDAFERAYLSLLLRFNEGRIGKTATKAGITSRALYEKMRHHGLRKEDFKPKK